MAGDLDPLSPRQREIVELIADGLADKQIARRLDMSFSAVRGHLSRIAEKIGADPTRNLRVQITWLVINSRYDADPFYRHPSPLDLKNTPNAA